MISSINGFSADQSLDALFRDSFRQILDEKALTDPRFGDPAYRAQLVADLNVQQCLKEKFQMDDGDQTFRTSHIGENGRINLGITTDLTGPYQAQAQLVTVVAEDLLNALAHTHPEMTVEDALNVYEHTHGLERGTLRDLFKLDANFGFALEGTTQDGTIVNWNQIRGMKLGDLRATGWDFRLYDPLIDLKSYIKRIEIKIDKADFGGDYISLTELLNSDYPNYYKFGRNIEINAFENPGQMCFLASLLTAGYFLYKKDTKNLKAFLSKFDSNLAWPDFSDPTNIQIFINKKNNDPFYSFDNIIGNKYYKYNERTFDDALEKSPVLVNLNYLETRSWFAFYSYVDVKIDGEIERVYLMTDPEYQQIGFMLKSQLKDLFPSQMIIL